MYVHFENWTLPQFISAIEAKGLPHVGILIKAYATYQDPREFIAKPRLVVIESSHAPFQTDEVFRYEGRRSYQGDELELKLKELGLQVIGADATRALFRFANRLGFCQTAMTAELQGEWLINHPFQDLHGFNHGNGDEIHLDIFYPFSIERLKDFASLDVKSQEVFLWREHRLLSRVISAQEGQRRHPER